MKIAELFVDLGIVGSEKTIGALQSTQTGLQKTSSLGLEAKAAILGAMYAIERLFSISNKTGTALVNFNAVTGVGAEILQRYQYAARQVGVSNEEVAQSFGQLQSAMVKTLMGQPAPAGLARVALVTGLDLQPDDLKKFAEQPHLLIQRLQDYAQKETNVALRNETLKSFGMSDQMIAAMARNAFRPEVLKKAPIYSKDELKNLNEANKAWANLNNTIEMTIGRFNAKYGGKLAKDIEGIVAAFSGLAESFMKLEESVGIFDKISESMKGWKLLLEEVNTLLNSKSQDTMNEYFTNFKNWIMDIVSNGKTLDLKEIMGEIDNITKELSNPNLPEESEKRKQLEDRLRYLWDRKQEIENPMLAQINALKNSINPETMGPEQIKAIEEKIKNLEEAQNILKTGKPSVESSPLMPAPTLFNPLNNNTIAPSMSPTMSSVNTNNNFEIKQELNFMHEGKNAQEVASSTKKAVRDAYFQSSALSQVV